MPGQRLLFLLLWGLSMDELKLRTETKKMAALGSYKARCYFEAFHIRCDISIGARKGPAVVVTTQLYEVRGYSYPAPSPAVLGGERIISTVVIGSLYRGSIVTTNTKDVYLYTVVGRESLTIRVEICCLGHWCNHSPQEPKQCFF